MNGSPIPDIISQGVDELLGALDAICLTDQGVSATQNLAIVDQSAMAGVSVSGNSFISPRDVEDRISGFEMLLEIVLG